MTARSRITLGALFFLLFMSFTAQPSFARSDVAHDPQSALKSTSQAAPDPLARFEALESEWNGGDGYVEQTLAQGRSKSAGSALAWGASYLWNAYLDAYRVSGDRIWLDKLVKEFDAALAARDDALGHADYKGRVRPVWGTLGYTGDEYHAWIVHNGVITYPMLRFVKLVADSPALKNLYGTKAFKYLNEVDRTVRAFDDQWRNGPRPGLGYYAFADDMPFTYHGQKMPLNQHNALGLTLFLLGDLTDNPSYYDRAVKMARYFKSVIKETPTGAYVWTYWGRLDEVADNPPQNISDAELRAFNGEDISHAAINARFAYEAFLHHAVFDRRDMQAIGRTVVQNIWSPDDRGKPAVNWKISGNGQVRKDEALVDITRGWIYFTQFDPRVYPAAARAFNATTNPSGTVALLGAAGLSRWHQSDDDILGALRQAAATGDPWAPPLITRVKSPRAGAVLNGPTPVALEALSIKPLGRVEVLVGGKSVYRGDDLPESLVLDQGKLADGYYVLETRIGTEAPNAYLDIQRLPFAVSNVVIRRPESGEKVRGAVSLMIDTGLPQSIVQNVDITLDDTSIYSGNRLPGALPLNTLELQDGLHRLSVKLTSKEGALSQKAEYFRVDNWWEIDDPFEPPSKSAWFGPLDRSKTDEESDGWKYATDVPDRFFGDKDRKVRVGNSTEYLIWKTPLLREVHVTVYVKGATQTSLIDRLELAVSADKENWQRLPYTVDQARSGEVAGASKEGASKDGNGSTEWQKWTLKAEVPADQDSAYFRLSLTEPGRSESDSHSWLQLGNVWLKGTVQ